MAISRTRWAWIFLAVGVLSLTGRAFYFPAASKDERSRWFELPALRMTMLAPADLSVVSGTDGVLLRTETARWGPTEIAVRRAEKNAFSRRGMPRLLGNGALAWYRAQREEGFRTVKDSLDGVIRMGGQWYSISCRREREDDFPDLRLTSPWCLPYVATLQLQ
jgi:hypothetical protein